MVVMEKEVPVLLGMSDAGAILGMPAATVQAAVRRGDIPLAAITPSGIRLLSRAAVEAYMQRHAEEPRFAAARVRKANNFARLNELK